MSQDKDEQVNQDAESHHLGDQPIESHFTQAMIAAMSALDDVFNHGKRGNNKDVGIVMLVFPYGEKKGRCNYISNGASRSDVAKLLEEQAKRFRGQGA